MISSMIAAQTAFIPERSMPFAVNKLVVSVGVSCNTRKVGALLARAAYSCTSVAEPSSCDVVSALASECDDPKSGAA